MTMRMREQLQRVSDLNTKCTMEITSVPLDLPDQGNRPAAEQVKTLAERITESIMASVERKRRSAAKGAELN